MASAFPTLSKKPSLPLPKKPLDSDIKSEFESGYEAARTRYTRDLFEYEVNYPVLIEADKVLLEAHISEVKSTVIFNWTHPIENTTIPVRYFKRPEIIPVGKFADGTIYYTTKFTLRMV